MFEGLSIEMFAFPLSAMLAAVMCILICLFDIKFRETRIYKSVTGWRFSVILLILLAVASAIEGTWALNLQHSIVFYVLVLITIFTVGVCTLQSIRVKKRISFILAHSGLFLILFGGFFGAPDFQCANLPVSRNDARSYAVTPDGYKLPLRFAVQLDEFQIDYYGDGFSPKQYTSSLKFYDNISNESDCVEMTTSVNKPCRHGGFLIYQSDYDKVNEDYSVIRLVRDPWIPVVFLGMLSIAAGALMGLRKTWKSKLVLPLAAALALVFGLISMANINLGTLAPALRSIWFVPHLIVYMLAYSILAIALVCAIVSLFGRKSAGELSLKLLETTSTLLLVGMLFGAVWAKIAWGDYWTWDAKECWAAATWLITLIGTHICVDKKNIKLTAIVLFAFLSMQVTWYGVNYLPSAQYSMHTYNY